MRKAITIMTNQHQHHICKEDITILDIINIIPQKTCNLIVKKFFAVLLNNRTSRSKTHDKTITVS